ncbi:MAG: CRISPR-associated endonuclease Cas1 [Acidobacteria bacterium]|nr:CRISPR-associated endonuclease Cas1 [Acidobacteriota bacterium]MBI3427491.1 CRISPR-associated endonuclease Cas1 [Acidobacteriota bacterium]
MCAIRPAYRYADDASAALIRGYEGQAASLYFEVFSLHLQQQRDDFAFTTRSKRPPGDVINCLLSYLYALGQRGPMSVRLAAVDLIHKNCYQMLVHYEVYSIHC